MTKATTGRKQEVLEAAMEEFIRNGWAGARLQSIADKTGITKAMIHYYFDTKENLFQEVFREACSQLFGNVMEILETDVPLFHKIDQFITEAHNQFFVQPELAGFVITELNRNHGMTASFLREVTDFDSSVFERQLETAASGYEIAPVDSRQVLTNILSLCLFPFAGNNLIKELLHMKDEQEYERFLKERRTIVSDTIINWLAS